MTNIELAQQQGNQAAPKLLDAVLAGEIGGGGISLILPEQAAITLALLDDYQLEAAQADETVAQTRYDNMKIVSPKLAFFRLNEVYTPESEEQEPQEFTFMALSSEYLDFLKNQADDIISIIPDFGDEHIKELLDSLTPDELFTLESESAQMLSQLATIAPNLGLGELPVVIKGVANYRIDANSDVCYYQCFVYPTGLVAVTHTAATILDTPVKLEKPLYEFDFDYDND